MTSDQEINHEYTYEIVCPYCGYEFSDSWDALGDYGECEDNIECYKCEEMFIAERYISVNYSTSKKEDDND